MTHRKKVCVEEMPAENLYSTSDTRGMYTTTENHHSISPHYATSTLPRCFETCQNVDLNHFSAVPKKPPFSYLPPISTQCYLMIRKGKGNGNKDPASMVVLSSLSLSCSPFAPINASSGTCSKFLLFGTKFLQKPANNEVKIREISCRTAE